MRPRFDPALGTGFAGWGATWVDFANSGTPDLLLAAGAIPVTSLSADAEAVRVLAPVSGATDLRERQGRDRGGGPAPERARRRRGGCRERRAHGRRDQHDRRQARAPAPVRPRRALARRAAVPVRPGRGRHRRASGRPAPDAHGAGGKQLSLVGGPARPLRPRRRDLGPVAHRALPVGRRELPQQRRREPCRADRVPAARRGRRHDRLRRPRSRTARPHRGRAGRSRGSGTTRRSTCSGWAARRSPSRPAISSTSRRRSRRPGTRPSGQQSRETAISYAAYRLLVWRASYGANLDRAFALLTGRLRGLCLSPDFTRASGGSAAELGNRIGAAAIAAGRHDGSQRGAPLRRPELHAGERAAGRPGRRLDGARRDVLAAAGALAEGRPGRRLRPGGRPDVRGLAVGPRAHVRGARRCRSAAPRRPVERRLQAGRRRGDPRHVAGGRPVRGGRVAARLEPDRCGAARRDEAPPRASRTTSGSISL